MASRFQRAVFFRCLATMFSSGIPLDRCLALLSRQTPEPDLQAAARSLSGDILKGNMLSEAMQRCPSFTPLQRQLVKVGENSGALATVFERLAHDEERLAGLEGKMRQSLLMPFWVGTVCLLVATLLPPFLFRGLLQMFSDARLTLPWPTRLLMLVSNGLRSPWMVVLLVVVAASLPRVWRHLRSLNWLAMPWLGQVLHQTALTRFVHALETTCLAGVALPTALELAAGASASAPFQVRMREAVVRLRQGVELRACLEGTGFLPAALIRGVETGLESGQLPKMMSSLYRVYEIELDHSLEVLTRACEPIFLALVGCAVGFTVVATMLPMAQLVQSF